MITKNEMPACPVATTVSLIGSKWKLLIMRNLLARPWRFNELNAQSLSQWRNGASHIKIINSLISKHRKIRKSPCVLFKISKSNILIL